MQLLFFFFTPKLLSNNNEKFKVYNSYLLGRSRQTIINCYTYFLRVYKLEKNLQFLLQAKDTKLKVRLVLSITV